MLMKDNNKKINRHSFTISIKESGQVYAHYKNATVDRQIRQPGMKG